MGKNYYKIEPDLSDDGVAYIDDGEFTYWPNKPKSEIIKNPDGTFSVFIEKDFIPLLTQLQNLFEDGKAPESDTYLGEAVLVGKTNPLIASTVILLMTNKDWWLVHDYSKYSKNSISLNINYINYP